MKKYFTDIIKPRWYIILLGIAVFAVQCTAIINLCYQFGGGYYLLIPLQVVTGYLHVLFYLMVQKDKKRRDFIPFMIICIALGAGAALLIFGNLFSSVPSVKGVIYGVMMIFTISMAFYTFLRAAKSLLRIVKRRQY